MCKRNNLSLLPNPVKPPLDGKINGPLSSVDGNGERMGLCVLYVDAEGSFIGIGNSSVVVTTIAEANDDVDEMPSFESILTVHSPAGCVGCFLHHQLIHHHCRILSVRHQCQPSP